MKSSHLTLAGAVCTGLLVVGPATAEGGVGAKLLINMVFQSGDTNGNGRLDAAEIEEMRMRGFDRADLNGDGLISKQEADAAAEQRRRRADMARALGEERFDHADADGDGMVSRAEYQGAPRPGFALVDTDGDGAIDRAEMDRVLAIVAASR